MTTESKKSNEKALLGILDIQWRDHFQTRSQTWKALEITALVAVALVGLDWRFGENRLVTIVTACLLAIVAMFAMQITIRHRNKVELTKFKIISLIEKQLSVMEDLEPKDPKNLEDLKAPKPIHLWDIFLFWKANTPLFILRMEFAILVFAVVYLVLRLTT